MSLISQLVRAVIEETPAGRRASERVLEAYESAFAAGEIERRAAVAKREWALMETMRALKECYPDRWEEVFYTAIGVKR